MISGEISQLGTSYAVALQAIECETGDTLARQLVEAPAKERVLSAVGDATTKLRERLGESLASIGKLDKPIEQATTPSLDALKAFVQGTTLRAQGQRLEAVTAYKRALELDPEFALAHARLGAVYQNLFENAIANQHRTRAFELRERASERERFYIESIYYQSVALDSVKARDVYMQWRQTYPRDSAPLNNLGVMAMQEGRNEEALDDFHAALTLDPNQELVQVNAINSATILGRFDDADRYVADAVRRFGETPTIQAVIYQWAIARNDEAVIRRIEQSATDASPVRGRIAAAAVGRGRLVEGRDYILRWIETLQPQGLLELAALNLAEHASREATVGEFQFAVDHRAEIQRMSPPDSIPQRVLAHALASNPATTALGDLLPRESPPGAPLLFYVGRAVSVAQLALNRGRAAEAIAVLEPLKDSFVMEGPGLRALEIYARALVSAGALEAAVAQFNRIRQTPGLDPTSPIHAVVHVHLARVYTRLGRPADARKSYETFFELWKNADPDVAILRHARTEYAKAGQSP
jgi:tetratricopeptide (TPR) repeat protein